MFGGGGHPYLSRTIGQILPGTGSSQGVILNEDDMLPPPSKTFQ
jgi:hypothetical protein